MNNIKVMSIFGTRPEAIKMAPVVKELNQEPQLDSQVVVTGQHQEMLDQVLDLFAIEPDCNLQIMKPGQTLAEMTSRILTRLSPVLSSQQPDLVLVHGDTTTTFSSALGAVYNQLSVAHIEAGLRSHHRYAPYPEEFNRRLAGVLADFHFAPTVSNRANLLNEGIAAENILVTGNTVVDALQLVVEADYSFAQPQLQQLDFSQPVVLVTAHRRENWGQPIENLCQALKKVAAANPQLTVVFPLHLNPNLRAKIKDHLQQIKQIKLLPPLDYREFINLLAKSYLVVTDSGGLQEEAPGLDVPVLVVRETTERQEGLAQGTIKLVGTKVEPIKDAVNELLTNEVEYNRMASAVNPYGDGQASSRIIAGILTNFDLQSEAPEDFTVF